MAYKIITDSSANLTDEMIEKYGIEILSLCFYVGEEEFYSYEKGKKSNLQQFYEKMRNKEKITTSLVSMEQAEAVMRPILESGNDVLYLGFSSGLSGTFQAISVVADQLREEYKERTIITIDTLAAALGEGLLVYHAARLKEEGKSLHEVASWVEDHRLNLCHWFTVDDLFFLKRGGRVSGTAAVLGTMLSVKPVMHVDNEGKLILIEKVRGRKKSLDGLVEHMKETAIDPRNQIVFISHGDCLEDAEYVAKRVKEELHVKDALVHILDPVIGAHSGPGTVALFYIGQKR